ncbi:MAG TPA: FKBP-type peptidyl-prolyl cis-trans isomerase [Candidatus Saccharimonadales bacterium]|nr:FKBP-type peptidyl-prolyl cis-trans isomerase [Candidatus Saccharimonadales bacterium]
MVKREHMHRFIWGFMAALFVTTALGVGIYAFVVNTHSNPNGNYLSCPVKSVGQQKPGKDGKYAGAQLVGFKSLQHIDYVSCQDLKVGTGATATATSTVTANYTGALASDGKIFQSSLDTGQPFTAALNSGVIQGWSAGVPGMKVGGTRRLFIPAQYAYGAQSVSGIPPNSDLVFDISLIVVQ